jgi:hypothetical protein
VRVKMARRPIYNDISIGKNRWIAFGDLADGQARASEIDPNLAPVMPFIKSLETKCVAGCCGIDAFNLWPDEIKKAIAPLDRRAVEKLASDLSVVQSEVERLPCDTVLSTQMNQYFRKTVFLEVLTHIRNVVESIQSNSAESDAAPGHGGR